MGTSADRRRDVLLIAVRGPLLHTLVAPPGAPTFGAMYKLIAVRRPLLQVTDTPAVALLFGHQCPSCFMRCRRSAASRAVVVPGYWFTTSSRFSRAAFQSFFS